MPRVAGALGLALALACLLGLANPLVAPQRALACSCAAGARLADVVDSPDVAVFTGVVGARLADRVPVAVNEWFVGPDAADIVWLRPADIFLGDGSVSSNTCGLTLAAGEARLFVAYGRPPEPRSTGVCSPGAPLDGPDGRALVAEARRVFGAPWRPPPPLPTDPPGQPSLEPQAVGDAWLYVVVAIGGTATIFLLAVLMGMRRRRHL